MSQQVKRRIRHGLAARVPAAGGRPGPPWTPAAEPFPTRSRPCARTELRPLSGATRVIGATSASQCGPGNGRGRPAGRASGAGETRERGAGSQPCVSLVGKPLRFGAVRPGASPRTVSFVSFLGTHALQGSPYSPSPQGLNRARVIVRCHTRTTGRYHSPSGLVPRLQVSGRGPRPQIHIRAPATDIPRRLYRTRRSGPARGRRLYCSISAHKASAEA